MYEQDILFPVKYGPDFYRRLVSPKCITIGCFTRSNEVSLVMACLLSIVILTTSSRTRSLARSCIDSIS